MRQLIQKYLVPFFLLFYTHVGYAQFAVMQDEDGYVNARIAPNVQSQAVHKVKDHTVFYVFEKTGKNGFKLVNIQGVNSKNVEDKPLYLHHSRIRYLSSFSPLSKTQKNSQSITISGYDYTINISSKPFQKNQHKIVASKENEYIQSIDGYTDFWGADGELPSREYSAFEITYQNNVVSIPPKMIGNLFNPDINLTSAYFDAQTNRLYLILDSGDDGLGRYNAVLIIQEGKIIKRFVSQTITFDVWN